MVLPFHEYIKSITRSAQKFYLERHFNLLRFYDKMINVFLDYKTITKT